MMPPGTGAVKASLDAPAPYQHNAGRKGAIMPDIIEPRVLKGFRDYLPEAEIARKDLIESLEKAFRSFGFVPIDTPVLEYAEILLGKGGGETDKQVYRFKDHGDRDVAMRFDLTVPFARFMAEHVDELYLPFRRYHMAKVWRGENTQRGRYREFMQCDFDIVGTEATAADTDIVLLILSALSALGIGPFTVRMNHRGLFNRFLASLGAMDKAPAVLRSVDKLDKVGREEVGRLISAEIGEAASAKVLDYIAAGSGFGETLDRLEGLAGGAGPDSERLREIHESAVKAGAIGPGLPGKLVLDPSITRGLDYYTGVVFEVRLDDMPEIGSVCGGGRYDELASLYTKRRLPGVGAAIGLDRLLTALETLGRTGEKASYTDVLVLAIEEGWGADYQGLAAELRRAGLAAEVYPEKKKLAQQFAYAERKRIPFALIRGGDEAAKGVVVLRGLSARENREFPSAAAAAAYAMEKLGR
jgi:histidyl-tRNA synthetase